MKGGGAANPGSAKKRKSLERLIPEHETTYWGHIDEGSFTSERRKKVSRKGGKPATSDPEMSEAQKSGARGKKSIYSKEGRSEKAGRCGPHSGSRNLLGKFQCIFTPTEKEEVRREYQ